MFINLFLLNAVTHIINFIDLEYIEQSGDDGADDSEGDMDEDMEGDTAAMDEDSSEGEGEEESEEEEEFEEVRTLITLFSLTIFNKFILFQIYCMVSDPYKQNSTDILHDF